MNVNLGSGPTHYDGWIEYDGSLNILLSRLPMVKRFLLRLGLLNSSHQINWDRQIKRANIVNLEFAPNSISNFYLSHVLEHVYVRESQKILVNVYSGLKPGGLVRICSPDYDKIISKYLIEKTQDELLAANTFEESLLSHPQVRPSGIEKIRRSLGGHIHYWHPFKTQLINQLRVAGFENITEHEYKSGNMDGIAQVETRSDNSFYLEARK
jgi:predicted SAM-dependent methyltransferase